MTARSTALIVGLLLAAPAHAATVTFNGQSYLDPFTALVGQRNMFLSPPVQVGQSLSLRFYDDSCVQKTAQVAANPGTYGAMRTCSLIDYYLDYASFFSLTLDGQQGPSATEQSYFFTLTFTPTSYVDPLSPNFGQYYENLLGYGQLAYSWSSDFAANNMYNYLNFEGAVAAPAPVPVGASVGLLGLALTTLGGFARRRRKA